MASGMNWIQGLVCVAALVVSMTPNVGCGKVAEMVKSEEVQRKDKWVQENLLDAEATMPFSFTYGGQPVGELLPTWKLNKAEPKKLEDGRTQYTVTWADPKSGLEVRCVAIEYSDYPVVEWTVYLKNNGKENTPILEGIQGLDATLQRGDGGEFVLHTNKGDWCTADSYEPYTLPLGPNAVERIAPDGGKATQGPKGWPYFNIQMPGGGMILAVGWPGRWAGAFTRDEKNALHVTAGQDQTHLYLKPGEEIRTPLIALLFWEGNDVARAQNVWRRWMLAHNLPRPHGKPLKPMSIFCSGGFFEGLKVSAETEKLFIDKLLAEKIHLDYWWMDAGWYPCNAWPETGTWEPDPARFPKGIKEISDYAHARKIDLIVWFEPERCVANSWITKNHPEWVFGGEQGGLVNLGNPEAWKWVAEHFNKLLDEQGIDLYRQDFNMDPLESWRNNDTPDRQGITENKYVCGYLAYWDEIQRRHPGMLIDSCSGGGRRNDIETLRRAVPLLRSDYQSFGGDLKYAPGNQGHTYGISSWFPFYGTGVYYNPDHIAYNVRSHMCPSFGICVDVRKEGTDWNLYRKLHTEWREIADCMLGDYYPLTPYSLADDAWIAWQFNRDDKGAIQAFRRDKNQEASKTFRLSGLSASAQYEVKNLDTEAVVKMSGKELMEKGLTVEIKEAMGSALIVYKRSK
jgi:alpha-galactosidase